MLARIQIEQAEIDLDVAVGRLNAAQRQDALPCARQTRDRRSRDRPLSARNRPLPWR